MKTKEWVIVCVLVAIFFGLLGGNISYWRGYDKGFCKGRFPFMNLRRQ